MTFFIPPDERCFDVYFFLQGKLVVTNTSSKHHLFYSAEEKSQIGVEMRVSNDDNFIFGELSHLLPPRQPLSHLWFGIFIHNFFKSEITEIFSYNNICSQIIFFIFFFFGSLVIWTFYLCQPVSQLIYTLIY